MYEERIIVVRAESIDSAVMLSEKKASEYCRDLEGCEYLGYVDVFDLGIEEITPGAEIFSAMQRSDLKPKEYLETFYPVAAEDCEAIGETHRWYNKDNRNSACYHCKVVREGQLWREK